MLSIFELLIIFTILTLNFAIIALFRNKIVIVASVMISNLIIILLCSMIIDDNQVLKELIIAIVIYCITILTLIYNSGHIDEISDKSNNKPQSKIILGAILLIIFSISCGGFYLVKNINFSAIDSNQNVQQNTQTQPISSTENLENQDQKKLQDNVLFKRSTDAILIIVGVMTILLLSSKYRNYESNI